MDFDRLVAEVIADVDRHCRRSPGYEEGPWVNPMKPVDPVAAFALAKVLVNANAFDRCVAIAPEGHLYGYFFVTLGVEVLSVHVDYPPRQCEFLDDLSVLRGKRVLILEDDVVSGVTLQLVAEALRSYDPQSLQLYLGRPKEGQVVENVAPAIETVYLAEEQLEPNDGERHQAEFIEFFSRNAI